MPSESVPPPCVIPRCDSPRSQRREPDKHELTYVIDGRKHLHAYGPRAATDEAFVPLLEQVFADRFHDDRPQ